MASIEVSLAGSRRRSAGAREATRELEAMRGAIADKDSIIHKYVAEAMKLINVFKSIKNYINIEFWTVFTFSCRYKNELMSYLIVPNFDQQYNIV